jgi:predicted ATPase
MLGDCTQAAQYKQKALDLAAELKQPFVLAYAHCYIAMHHNLLCEFSSAAHHAGVTLEISQRHGFLAWLSWGFLQLAIARGGMGGGDGAIAQLTQTLAMQQMAGAEIAMSYFLGGLAEGYRVAGRVEEALDTVEKAIDHADRHGERWYESVLYRMRGDLRALGGPGASGAAEADYSRAVEIARQQGAKLLELQGALKLHALCLDHGRPEPSRSMLQNVCMSFAPDALDIPELQEARALLSRSHAAT